jgi:hypothetical protein
VPSSELAAGATTAGAASAATTGTTSGWIGACAMSDMAQEKGERWWEEVNKREPRDFSSQSILDHQTTTTTDYDDDGSGL